MKTPSSIRTHLLSAILLLQHSILCFLAHGAAGDVDLSFDPGFGVNGPVNAVAVEADGKVIIGGQFTTVRGLARTNLARLNADGSGDPTFNPGTVFSIVHSLAFQPDGKLLVGGGCAECYDYPYSILTRLHSNGNADPTFSNAFIDGRSSVLTLQTDGRILVGGDFNTVNGAGRNGIARLNANGTLDTSFDPGTGIGGYQPLVFAIAVESDGNVIVGGIFDTFNGTNHSGIARLNANGSLDNSFNPGPEVGYRVESVAVQTDGKLLVVGYFSKSIARLNADGSLDSSFNAGTGANGVVSSVKVQGDGKVLIVGYFTAINGTDRKRVARLNADGSLDSGFYPGTGMNYAVSSVVVQPDGKVLVGGGFTTVNDTRRNRVARLNSDGSLDSGFDPGRGLENAVFSLAMQPDGKVLIGNEWMTGGTFAQRVGVFTFVNGTNRYGSARLNADGSLDDTFINSTHFSPNLAVVDQYDDCPPGNYGCEKAIVPAAVLVQADGKVLIGGHVQTTVSGDEVFIQTTRYFLARFNDDGSLDTSFEPAIQNPDLNGGIAALAVQPDGKVIVGGAFYSIKGTSRNGIARLNADGTLDSSFNPGTGADGVYSIALQPDGKVLIGGWFTAVNGTNRNHFARLNANGSLDGSFNPGTGANDNVSSVIVQSDGNVLIGGAFTTVNGTNRNQIARLNANGSLDSSFNPGTGADGIVRSMALQPDGKVLIGGDFLTVNGVMSRYVARLYGDAILPPVSFATWAASFGLSGSANADPDLDGLASGVEYILGGNPSQPSPATPRPTVNLAGGGMLFTFSRADASETPDVTLTVESGTDLVTWPDVFTIGPNDEASTHGVTILENGTAPDTITVAIPAGSGTARFARLRATIAP